MDHRASLKTNAKALFILACVCAFFSVFATFDASEHNRAWRTARGWTDTQKAAAPATDADSMHSLILTALVADTAVIVLSFACLMTLGISVATDSRRGFAVAKGIGWATIAFGLVFSIFMIIYKVGVGPRLILKGPIYDYDLSLQPPIALAMGAYPVAFATYLLYCLRKKPKSADQV